MGVIRNALFLGVDVGSTSTKAALLDSRGACVARCRAVYRTLASPAPGALEFDPRDCLRAFREAVRGALRAPEAIGRLTGVCIGGQASALVAVGRDMRPLSPILCSHDMRAWAEADTWSSLLGAPAHPSSPLAKALWLKRHLPEAYEHSAWLLGIWELVIAGLTGKVASSLSPPLPRAGSFPIDRAKWPAAVPCGKVVGEVSAEGSRSSGLPQGLPVVMGAVDSFLGCIGAGAVQPGLGCLNGGSGGGFLALAPRCDRSRAAARFFLEENPLVGLPLSSTGRALDWFCSAVARMPSRDVLRMARTVSPGAGALIFIPSLSGERDPLGGPDACGAFFGCTTEHSLDSMGRAVLEGVAFLQRQAIQTVEGLSYPVTEVRLHGGQARSQLWNQIKADVFGRPVSVPQTIDAPAVGAAFVAGKAMGAVTSYTVAARDVAVKWVYYPKKASVNRYERLFRIFQDLCVSNTEIRHRLSIERKRPE